MNKISMDALNRGWSIGFGTRIQVRNDDFDEALSREAGRAPERVQHLVPAQAAKAPLALAEAFALFLRRRPAQS
jgi:hypothetical protein